MLINLEPQFLQCAIPVFDGLLPEPHNKRLTEMLFLLAYWQGLAKLRLHTESTLAILDDITRSLGISLRAFKKNTCSMFQTKELPVEAAARRRREEALTRKRGIQKAVRHDSTSEPRPPVVNATTTASSTTRKRKGKEVVCEAVTGRRTILIQVEGLYLHSRRRRINSQDTPACFTAAEFSTNERIQFEYL